MFKTLITLVFATFATAQGCSHENFTTVGINPVNNCVQFTVASGTGCQWMCNYCADQLGTFNYYFTDGVCTYQTGGCVGNPIAGKIYSCCAV